MDWVVVGMVALFPCLGRDKAGGGGGGGFGCLFLVGMSLLQLILPQSRDR